MKILSFLFILTLSACVTLTAEERDYARQLAAENITPAHPCGNWENPANPGIAGVLNLLPGFGNFYLASGNGADGHQYLVGAANLITWPMSILWGVPQAVIDAQTLNQRELNYYCKNASPAAYVKKSPDHRG